MNEIARRRANLMKQHPYCYWCGRKLIYFKIDTPAKKLPDDFATIDHINSKLTYPDGRPKMGMQVLSCPKCNQDRARREEIALGVEELNKRAHKALCYRVTEPLEESADAFKTEVWVLKRA